MECPHCQKELPGKTCPFCGKMIPEESRFCLDCGERIEEGSQIPGESDDASEDAFEMENRVLCSDGTCTGIIVNGKCSECGKGLSEKNTSDS